jgi:hypothetical protein
MSKKPGSNKKKCPYCGKVVSSQGLNGHVLNSSDDKHGDFQKTPEGFDPSEIETFTKGEKKAPRNSSSKAMRNRIYLCNYCNELCEGAQEFENHLNERAGDVLHPENGNIEDNEYTLIPADENWNPIMDLEDVYRIQKHRRRRGEITGQVSIDEIIEKDNNGRQIATILENRPELEDEPERIMAIVGATEEEFKQGVKILKERV